MKDQIEFYSGKDHPRRGICFLLSDNKKVNAKSFYNRLVGKKENIGRAFRTRFDAWIGGQPNKPARYHGWDKNEFQGKYVHCFVFKRNPQRLYGFLCNPKSDNPRYQLCVLVIHASKNTHKSDENILKQVEEIRVDIEKMNIIANYFKENKR